MYDPSMTRPMEQELTMLGVTALKSGDEVDQFVQTKKESGTSAIVINSVCGCAAGGCRPGIRLALSQGVAHDQVATVFAGVDREATAQARSYASDFPPSSPSILFFRDGEVVDYVPRHLIEGRRPEEIAKLITERFGNS